GEALRADRPLGAGGVRALVRLGGRRGRHVAVSGPADGPDIFREVAALMTEGRNPRTADLDSLDTLEILKRINEADQEVPGKVRDALPAIARAVEMVVASFRAGGRLIHVGAGTSGRLGVLDAAE